MEFVIFVIAFALLAKIGSGIYKVFLRDKYAIEQDVVIDMNGFKRIMNDSSIQ